MKNEIIIVIIIIIIAQEGYNIFVFDSATKLGPPVSSFLHLRG